MDIETAGHLARNTTASEIARQRSTFAALLAEDIDSEERTRLTEAVATLDEAARIQEAAMSLDPDAVPQPAWIHARDGVQDRKVLPGVELPIHSCFINYTNPGYQQHMMSFDLWEGTVVRHRFTPTKIIKPRIGA